MKACVKCGKEYDDDQLQHCPNDETTLVNINADLAPGTVLGDRYEVIAVIADGGMGKVYKAKHRLIDKTVAIKTILPNMVMSGAVLKRFQQEAHAISKLNHPAILSITDFFVSQDAHPYLVTDFLKGESLQQVIDAEGAMPEARALRIFKQICAGLKHAHLHAIIHRDLKPANVMLIKQDDQDDIVKIIDFGIAKVLTESQKNRALTETGDVFGSPQYMSPEQCRGRPLDSRSDIYSLGCIMFAMLSGKPPFIGGDDLDYMFKHVHEAPPELPPSTSPQVCAAVAKMLQKEPADRFENIDALVAAVFDGPGVTGETMVGKAPAGLTTTPPSSVSEAPLGAAVSDQALRGANPVPTTVPPASATNPPATTPASVTGAPSVGAPVSDEALRGANPAQTGTSRPKHIPIPKPALAIVVAGALAGLAMLVPHPSEHPVKSLQPPPPAPVAVPQPAAVPQSAAVSQPAQVPQPAAVPQPTPAQPTATQVPVRATRPTPVSAQPQTREQIYTAAMQKGKYAFKVSDYKTAQHAFRAAHDASFYFGSRDPRFIDSLLWQSKTAAKLGIYQVAIQGFQYVIEVRKTSGDKKGLAEAEAALRETNSQLHRFDSD